MNKAAWSASVLLAALWGCGGSDDGDGTTDQEANQGGSGAGIGTDAHGGGSSGGSNGGTDSTAGGAVGGNSTTGDGDPRQGGIGRACDSDSDCEDGQFCNADFEDYIGHKQCTASCFEAADCEEFGELTMCIGANICTARCLTDEDCPALTRCSDNGWCDRTGPGSGNPYCTGSPTPCGLLDEFDCTSALGCSYDGRCSGVSPSCYSQFSSFSCSSVDGCYWSYSTESCSGVSYSCSSYNYDFECTRQDGCSWSGSCTGQPLVDRCEDEPAALCEFTPGCTLVVP